MSRPANLLTSDFIVPAWPLPVPGMTAFSTTRRGGVSIGAYGALDGSAGLNLGQNVGDNLADVAVNRARVNQYLPAPAQFLNQVHGSAVLDAGTLVDIANPCADAVVSHQAGQVCVVQTADCLPVLFCDTRGRVVGAAHAGWRGLAAGVLEATVAHMQASGAGDIMAWLGPAIGPLQFEVGEEVVDVFATKIALAPQFFVKKPQPGKYLADIYGLARAILQTVGIQHISGGEYCTVSQPELFYSYRRDRITGRMASLIWIN